MHLTGIKKNHAKTCFLLPLQRSPPPVHQIKLKSTKLFHQTFPASDQGRRKEKNILQPARNIHIFFTPSLSIQWNNCVVEQPQQLLIPVCLERRLPRQNTSHRHCRQLSQKKTVNLQKVERKQTLKEATMSHLNETQRGEELCLCLCACFYCV